MSALRGFGFTFDVATRRIRNWYVAEDGKKRWLDNNEPVEEPRSDWRSSLERRPKEGV